MTTPRPVYSTTDLEYYLEGWPIDTQTEYARVQTMSIQRTEERDITEQSSADWQIIKQMSDQQRYQHVIAWNTEDLEVYASLASQTYRRVEAARQDFEVMRRIVEAWNPHEPIDEDTLATIESRWRPTDAEVASLDTAIETMFDLGQQVCNLVDIIDGCVERWHAAMTRMSDVDTISEWLNEQ